MEVAVKIIELMDLFDGEVTTLDKIIQDQLKDVQDQKQSIDL